MKINKIVMLSIALLMVNSGAFASESTQEKVKKSTKNALSKIADAATNTVSNVVSSAVQVVKDHPVATIVAGAAVFAGVVGTETGRNAFKSAKDAVVNGVSSAATALYNHMPANSFGLGEVTFDDEDDQDNQLVHVFNMSSQPQRVFVKKEFTVIQDPAIKVDFLSLDLADESVKKIIAGMFEEALQYAGDNDFKLNINGRSGHFCIKITTYEPKDISSINNGECVFCKRAYKGKVLDENDHTIAFEKGKERQKCNIDFLITPKAHAVNYKDSSFTSDMFINQLIMAQTMANDLNDSGDVILSVNNGKGAGQTVFHSHMHFKSTSSWKRK